MSAPTSDADRRRAATAHLLVPALGLGLPYTLRLKRQAEPFLAHHGHQATFAALLLLLLGGAHAVLHGAISLVIRLERWASTTEGVSGPAWAKTALELLPRVNLGALAVEVVVLLVLAIRHAHQARRGELCRYFFVP